MVTLECLTIIENLDGPFEEHHFLDVEIILREFAEKQQKENSTDEKKLQLIGELKHVIKDLESRNIEI
jgi:hypothetical protein